MIHIRPDIEGAKRLSKDVSENPMRFYHYEGEFIAFARTFVPAVCEYVAELERRNEMLRLALANSDSRVTTFISK